MSIDLSPLTADEIGGTPADTASSEEWRPVMPVPETAPPLTGALLDQFAPRGFQRAGAWKYVDAQGRMLGAIARFDRAGDTLSKQVLPITYCQGTGGRREWRAKGFPTPRPLFGLDALASRPDAPVIVVEGEKTAAAASKRFGDFVATTSPGGSKAARKADWSPLKGRRVVIWPDADAPGAAYAVDVAELAQAAGAASVATVKLPAGLPTGWDLADAPPVSMTDADLARILDSAGSPAAWGAPVAITSSLPPVEPFEPEMLPEALRAYVFDVADRQQSVPDFVAVAALCGLAAMIGNRVRVGPKQNDDWIEVPNLWGAIIGPPSAMKSPAMQSALGPVYALQDEMRQAWQASIEAGDIDDVLSSIDEKEAKKRAAKAIKDGDRDTARSILADLQKDDDDEPPCPRIVVNDATVEKLGELLNENPRGLLLMRDELPGFLARMESEEYASERAFYLEAFNGSGRFTYDRIGRGTVHIANCTLSLIGGVQPSRIAPIVRGAITGTSNDGLVQRLQLAVWPDLRSSWRWVDRHPSKEARDAFEKVFRDLHEFPLGRPDQPLVLRFSPDGQDLFRAWMEEIQSEARAGNLSPVLEAHLLKMPKTVASLALLFELIDGGKFEIGRTATLRALAWADYLRSHARRLYASGGTMVEDGARLIVERRGQLPDEFSARDVYRKHWAGLSDGETVADAIELLIKTNHCRETKRAETQMGRPAIAYQWNPALGAPTP
ncbi:MAG: hypothetical protein H6R00_748 [Proteobacteria bacterium]|nr:hypothetical protein [Pseudomonadota bacterium]